MKYYFDKQKVISLLDMDAEEVKRNQWLDRLDGQEIKFESGKNKTFYRGLIVIKAWCSTKKESNK